MRKAATATPASAATPYPSRTPRWVTLEPPHSPHPLCLRALFLPARLRLCGWAHRYVHRLSLGSSSDDAGKGEGVPSSSESQLCFLLCFHRLRTLQLMLWHPAKRHTLPVMTFAPNASLTSFDVTIRDCFTDSPDPDTAPILRDIACRR